MSGVASSNQDADIDLARLFAAVWERKKRVLGTTVLAAGVAFAATMMMAPRFRGEARIRIEARSPTFIGGQAQAGANDPVLDTLNITSQAEVLQSSDLIKQVAHDLRLSEVGEFDPDGQSLLPNPLVLLGLAQDPLSVAPEERVIREFREKLKVYPVENSRIIAIEFSSHDARLAAAIPNKMAEVYLTFQSGAKLDTQSDTAKWLEPEIAVLTEKVREAERKVADYRSDAGLFQTAQSGSFAAQQLNDISAELTRVRGERANAQARAENVRAALDAGRDSDTLTDVVGSQVIQRLKETEANLQAIRRQIDSETQKILASLDNEAEVARLREEQLVQQLNALKANSAKVGEEEVGLRALEREATAQRQLLETYLARYREAASRQGPGAAPPDARIVSTAIEPLQPYFPKVVPIVVVVALASLILSAITILLAELLSGRALKLPAGQQLEEAESEQGVHHVHRMQADAVAEFERIEAAAREQAPEPSADLPRDAPAAAVPDAEEDAFGIDNVASYLGRHAVSVALAVSPEGDQGSTATVMLSREVADQGRTAVLIDMTGSALPSRLMGAVDLPGVTDLLCGQAAFGEAIHPDRLSDAHIIPRGRADAATAMKGIDRLVMIIDALAEAYDHVLVECGPADLEGISRLCRGLHGEIIFSVGNPADEAFLDQLKAFAEAGYTNLLVMQSGGAVSGRRQQAA